MDHKLFLDSNALLNLQEKAFDEPFVISQKTLEEVEQIKSSAHKDGEIKWKARQISHLLDKRQDQYEVVRTTGQIKNIISEFDLEETPDSIILAAAYWYNQIHPIVVVSDDINAKFISKKIFNLPTKSVDEIHLVADMENYTGYKDVTFTDEEMSFFYTHIKENTLNLRQNEYLIIRKSDGEIVDYRRWSGVEYAALSYIKTMNTSYMGKIRPRNPQQILAFDMLQNKTETIKILSGKQGTGKDIIMLAHALKMIDDGRFDKLLYIRNAVTVKDAGEIGFLPGTALEKMKLYSMALADHLGGEMGLDMQISAGRIEIEHLGYIRGRSLKNCIVYVSEAENLTREHVQLLIGRIDEGSELWMNGDFKQTDSPTFRMNNGLLSAVTKLAGYERFGYVRLEKTERSETAAMADLLD